MRRGTAVHRKFHGIRAARHKIFRQEGIQFANQLFGDFGIVVEEFKSFLRCDVENRSSKSMLTQGKTHIHSRVGHRDFNPAARTRKEQHQGRQRQRHADSEHNPGNFSRDRFPRTLAVIEDFGATEFT